MDTAAILQARAHRPWPLPSGPWMMTQIWQDLLFAHWPIAPEALRPLLPSALQLDTFAGQAWVSIVPFHVRNSRLRWAGSLPQLQFSELNVRTYVQVAGITGVYFCSLDASSWLAVSVARAVFHLPYFRASMRIQHSDGTIRYESRRTHRGAPPAEFVATYRPVGPIAYPQPGSLEHWLTERYCLYTVVNHTQVYRADIHHRPWPLQPAELVIARNTMARACGIHLPAIPPLLHYVQQQETLFWPLRRVR